MIDLLEAMYKALASERGIIVRFEDPVRAKALFYKEREKDLRFSNLSIYVVPFSPNEFAIAKKDVYNANREKRRARKENPEPEEG